MTELVDKRADPWRCNFEEIEIGDFFEYEGNLYVAIEEYDMTNAFNFTKKLNAHLRHDEPVIPVDATITIY